MSAVFFPLRTSVELFADPASPAAQMVLAAIDDRTSPKRFERAPGTRDESTPEICTFVFADRLATAKCGNVARGSVAREGKTLRGGRAARGGRGHGSAGR